MQAQKADVPSDRAFLKWLIASRSRDVGIFFGGVYIAVALISNRVFILGDLLQRFGQTLANRSASDWLPAIFQSVALIILPVICFNVEPPRWVNERYSLAIAACKQFRNALSLLIVTWIVFYFIIFLREIGAAGPRWDPWIDLLNTLQGVFLFVCYWVLTAKTIPGNGGAKDPPASGAPPLWTVYSVLLWLLVVFLVADVYFSPDPKGPDITMTTIRIGFRLVSGLWVGVALALLIGCLEGQYVGQPRAVTVLLYFYAVLQLGYVGFNFKPSDATVTQSASAVAGAASTPAASVQNNAAPVPSAAATSTGSPGTSATQSAGSQGKAGSSVTFLQVFTTVTSLPLKLLFIGYWYWVLQNGLLAFYMKKTRQDIDLVPCEWADFSFDFVLRASPHSQSIAPGDSATYTIHVDASSKSSNSVDLDLRGMPEGATAAFHPPSVALDGKNSETTYLTITTSSSTLSGDYSLTIVGKSGSMERTVSVGLSVGTGRSKSVSAPN